MHDENKPPMPKESITLELPPIKARLLHDFDRYSSGHLIMSATEAKATDEQGNVIGYIRGCIGSPTIEVSIYRDQKNQEGGRAWVIDPEEIFKAVFAADEAREKELKNA